MQNAQTPSKPYYGWYISITLAITETISWGILYYAFSVFLSPMEQELGWSRAELTTGFSLSLLMMGAMAFPVGAWIDRHGARGLMTIGSIIASILVLAWSQVTDRTTFYAIWIGIGACCAAVLYEPAFTVIAAWFRQRRGTALAVITFAAGLASTIFLPLSDALLTHFGWRTSVAILGIFLAIMTIPLHALILRRRPADIGLLLDGADASVSPNTSAHHEGFALGTALRGRAFWLLTLGFALASLSAAAIRVHFIPFLIATGIPSSTAAVATGTIGIMQVVGRVIFAPLDQRFPGNVMIIGIFGLQAIAMAILCIGGINGIIPLIGLFIFVFGATQGASTLIRPSLIASLYGSKHYGRISSVMTIFLTLTGTVAPLGASLLYDRFGNYDALLWVILILAIASTVIFLIANQAVHRLSVLSLDRL